jgi:hypothetical protein
MKPALLITLLLAAGLLAGCEPDPVIGRWTVQRNGARVAMDFRPDGTVAVDFSEVEAQARARGVSPAALERVLGKVKRSHVTWQRQGAVYRTETVLDGRSAPPRYLKREGSRLVPCSAEGKPTGERPLERG